MNRHIGIDYSLSNPSLTILGNDDTFENSQTYYLTDKKKYVGKFGNIEGVLHKPFTSFMERYENIADCIISLANVNEQDYVSLEDYSMGSKGLLFSIAENTAILKYRLYLKNISINLVSPASIKKSFTGKGNADKNLMYTSFLNKTGIDLLSRFNIKMSLKIGSPFSDIIDSYALALLGKENDHRRL